MRTDAGAGRPPGGAGPTDGVSAEAFLRNGPAALVEVVEARGSTPRDSGAWMLVGPTATYGTIGGGRLEHLAIERAREALAEGSDSELDVPLGPEIAQCCGGRVGLAISLDAAPATDRERRERAGRPHVYVFGHGHVGEALKHALSALPVNVGTVDTRPDFGGEGVTITPLPEQVIDAAPQGSAFVILTHDHGLDYLLVDRALARGNDAYIGLIGSATKRATFAARYRRDGHPPERFERVTCPIAADAPDDKRPEVIALFAAAEVARALLRDPRHHATTVSQRPLRRRI